MWNEFKKFAFKGNVLDLAVGVIIGLRSGKSFLHLSMTLSCRLSGSLLSAKIFLTLHTKWLHTVRFSKPS